MPELSSCKIRGCLYGMLSGDCLGKHNDGGHSVYKPSKDYAMYKERIIDFVLDFPESWFRNGQLPKVAYYSGFTNYVKGTTLYSSGTAMSRNVIESLLESDGFSAENMMKKFTETYSAEKNVRCYRPTVGIVFENSIKRINSRDVYNPAKEQFGGNGSFGAYGAVRSSPIALYYADDLSTMIEVTKQQCLLTHAHPNAIMGSVLQVAAVYFALHNTKFSLKSSDFLTLLGDVMKQQEKLIYRKAKNNPYNEKFAIMKKFLENNEPVNVVGKALGAGNRALNAVTAAIFSFVKCFESFDEFDLFNPIVRTISYSIALGGDTNVVAAMAGAIAGAYYGDNFIPITWLKTFEDSHGFLMYSREICRKVGIDLSDKLNNNNASLTCFRGCLLGALAGDCFGSIYEGDEFSDKMDAKKCRENIATFIKDFPIVFDYEKRGLIYTANTAMLRNIAESLIVCDCYDPIDSALKLSETCFHDKTYRGYTLTALTIFQRMRETNYNDIFQPAKELFHEVGSYGSAGALRVPPMVLFYANDLNETMEYAKCQCFLTNIHPHAVMGTILQAAAVHLALKSDFDSLDPKVFLSQLRDIMKKQENTIYPGIMVDNPYNKKLDTCELLLTENNGSPTKVARLLGNTAEALSSVPTALFAFLYCLKPIKEIEIDNSLLRTLAYAISLGGDTGTIAALAGSIVGAYYGDSCFPKPWLTFLEGGSEILQCAETLHKKLLKSLR